MKVKTIMQKAARDNVKFELAAKMREMLDAAKKQYGEEWDDDSVEEQIAELVFGDDEE